MAEADWKYLLYNVETGQKRTGDGPSGGASSLSDLDDTSISNPSDGQMLGYDETEGKWKNVAAPGGNVDDVEVNGVSVVNAQKVAKITSYKEVTQAQYEALPDTKLSDGILYAIKDGGQAVDGFPPLIYSDEEREVGVWRDGKSLYQKSYHFEGVLNQDVLIDSTITQNDNELVNVFGSWAIGNYHYANSRQASIFETIKFLNNTTPHPIVFVNSSGLYYNSNQNNYGFHMYLTIQYTKTTDTPGSGTWTTQGALAHHYSTTEKVIGTWIDGKPLYEKVTTFGAIAAGTSNSRVASGASNIDTMVEYKVYVTEYGNKVSLPYPLFASTDNYSQYSINCQGYDPVNNNFRIDTGREIPVTDGYIIFKYTKTTD